MASGRPMVKRVLAAFPVGPVEIRSKTVSCASAIKSGLCLVQRCICMSELCHSQGAKGQVPCSAWSCLPVSWSPLTERFGFQVIPRNCALCVWLMKRGLDPRIPKKTEFVPGWGESDIPWELRGTCPSNFFFGSARRKKQILGQPREVQQKPRKKLRETKGNKAKPRETKKKKREPRGAGSQFPSGCTSQGHPFGRSV